MWPSAFGFLHCFDDPSHSTSKAEVADADADDLPNLN